MLESLVEDDNRRMHGSGVITIPYMAMGFYLCILCTYAYDARRALSSACTLCVFLVNDDNDVVILKGRLIGRVQTYTTDGHGGLFTSLELT